MTKILKEEDLSLFNNELVYITIGKSVEGKQIYHLNTIDYTNHCFKCMLSIDVFEDIDDIIEDLESVCKKVVLEIDEEDFFMSTDSETLISNDILDFYKEFENYTFNESINLNHHFKDIINEAYKRSLLNTGKSALSCFYLRYIEMFNTLVNNSKNNNELYDLSVSLVSSINSFFDDLNLNLYIKNQEHLNKFKSILKISLILIEGVIENNDIDSAYECFSQLKRRIKKGKFYTNNRFTYEYGSKQMNNPKE